MSAEILAIVIAASGLLVTLFSAFFAGIAWLSRRMDDRFDKVDARFEKVDARFDRGDERIDEVRAELTEVKIAVARLEGPRPRLSLP